MNAVLQPIVDDLKKLGRPLALSHMYVVTVFHVGNVFTTGNGYIFQVLGVSRELYGTLAVISANNPASTCLGGFKECSSANYLCRQCHTSNDEVVSESSLNAPQNHHYLDW